MSELSDAHARLEEAIAEVSRLELADDGEQLLPVHWVVAVAAVDANEPDGMTYYGHVTPHGTQSSHISIGLLDLTAHRLRTRGWNHGDD